MTLLTITLLVDVFTIWAILYCLSIFKDKIRIFKDHLQEAHVVLAAMISVAEATHTANVNKINQETEGWVKN